jgi:tetratricopeptide (TPR) repeat protein
MTHDIYTSRSKGGRGEKPYQPGKTLAPGQDVWASSLRRQRWQNALSIFLFVLILSLVVVISFQQHLLSAPETSPGGVATDEFAELPLPRTPVGRVVRAPDELYEYMIEVFEEDGLPEPVAAGSPPHADAVKWVAYHLLQAEQAEREERLDDAVTAYEEALRIFPDLRGAHLRVGLIYLGRQEYDAAIETLLEAWKREPESFGVANNLAVAYVQSERLDEAEEALLRAVQLEPTYAAAHHNLAMLYSRRGQQEEAARFFRTFLQLDPENVEATLSFAAIMIQNERWRPAANLLARADRLAPDSPPILFRLAQSHGQAGQTREALNALRRAAQLVDVRYALAWLSRPEFDPLRRDPEFQAFLADLSGVR